MAEAVHNSSTNRTMLAQPERLSEMMIATSGTAGGREAGSTTPVAVTTNFGFTTVKRVKVLTAADATVVHFGLRCPLTDAGLCTRVVTSRRLDYVFVTYPTERNVGSHTQSKEMTKRVEHLETPIPGCLLRLTPGKSWHFMAANSGGSH